jgi:hypothetical protein
MTPHGSCAIFDCGNECDLPAPYLLVGKCDFCLFQSCYPTTLEKLFAVAKLFAIVKLFVLYDCAHKTVFKATKVESDLKK